MASLLSLSPLKTCIPKTRAASIPAASSPSAAATTSTTSTESLDQKFGRKGIKFSDSTVELTVRNGSSLKLQIPGAHVTSYKPKVYWKDDGFEEVLYSLGDAGGKPSNYTGRGGIGLVVEEEDQKGASRLRSIPAAAATQWTVKDVDSDSTDALQVELSCIKGSLDINYVVSLYPLSMATALIIKNNGRQAIGLTTAMLNHFRLRKRSGAGVQGLRGCSYCTHPPLSSPFEILSPSEAIKPEDPAATGLFSFGSWEPEKKVGQWTVQDVPITVLRHKLSRVYAVPPSERSNLFYRSSPSKYEIIDQGRELFFRVIRMGFDEIYLSGPGSVSEKYGKDYFICTGPMSMLVPVILNPGEEWRGAQVIEHDNL